MMLNKYLLNICKVMFVILILILFGGIWRAYTSQNSYITSDLNSLLPNTSTETEDKFLSKINNESIFIIYSEKQENNSENIPLFISDFKDVFKKYSFVSVITKQDLQKIGAFYFQNRYAFNPPKYLYDESIIKDFVIESIYSPFGGITDNELLYDPFLIVRNIVSSSNIQDFNVDTQGYIYKIIDNKRYYLVRVVNQKQLTFDERKQIVNEVKKLKKTAQRYNINLLYTGSLFFSEKSASNSIDDMSIVGGISSICLLIVLLTIFRSVMPIIWSFSILGISLFTGFCNVLLIQGSVHVITLAIGSSLIGICFDYILHIFMFKAQYFVTVNEVRNKLGRPLLLSLLTSIVAYLIMPAVGLNILKQLGIFAVTSLITTFVLVYLILSYAKIKPLKDFIFLKETITNLSNFLNFYKKTLRIATIYFSAIFVLISFIILEQTPANDDIAAMQDKDSYLVELDKNVRNIVDNSEKISWLLLSRIKESDTDTVEDLFQECEIILNSLTKDELKDIFLPCYYVPSKQQQQKNINLYQKVYPLLKEAYFENGIRLDDEKVEVFKAKSFLYDNNPLGLNFFISEQGMLLRINANNLELLNKILANKNVKVINQRQDWSNAFAKYHQRLNIILIITILLSFIITSFIMKKMVLINYIIPITLGVLFGLTVNCFVTSYFNLFTTLACFMIVGLGTDYCIFLYHTSKHEKYKTILTLFIALITTESAFGLLAFSGTSIVRSFGIVVAVGLLVIFIIAVMNSFISVRYNESND
ncbi:MAG: hypothetical protein ACI4V7_00355 [Succinivibrionaceae bacterium]